MYNNYYMCVKKFIYCLNIFNTTIIEVNEKTKKWFYKAKHYIKSKINNKQSQNIIDLTQYEFIDQPEYPLESVKSTQPLDIFTQELSNEPEISPEPDLEQEPEPEPEPEPDLEPEPESEIQPVCPIKYNNLQNNLELFEEYDVL